MAWLSMGFISHIPLAFHGFFQVKNILAQRTSPLGEGSNTSIFNVETGFNRRSLWMTRCVFMIVYDKSWYIHDIVIGDDFFLIKTCQNYGIFRGNIMGLRGDDPLASPAGCWKILGVIHDDWMRTGDTPHLGNLQIDVF